jgi:preprotein translocase subunit SecG
MQTVLIVIHLMIVVALVGVVLLQRSEGGALGMGGGGSGGFMSARGAADTLTRTTDPGGRFFHHVDRAWPARTLRRKPDRYSRSRACAGAAGRRNAPAPARRFSTFSAARRTGGANRAPAKPAVPAVPNE